MHPLALRPPRRGGGAVRGSRPAETCRSFARHALSVHGLRSGVRLGTVPTPGGGAAGARPRLRRRASNFARPSGGARARRADDAAGGRSACGRRRASGSCGALPRRTGETVAAAAGPRGPGSWDIAPGRPPGRPKRCVSRVGRRSRAGLPGLRAPLVPSPAAPTEPAARAARLLRSVLCRAWVDRSRPAAASTRSEARLRRVAGSRGQTPDGSSRLRRALSEVVPHLQSPALPLALLPPRLARRPAVWDALRAHLSTFRSQRSARARPSRRRWSRRSRPCSPSRARRRAGRASADGSGAASTPRPPRGPRGRRPRGPGRDREFRSSDGGRAKSSSPRPSAAGGRAADPASAVRLERLSAAPRRPCARPSTPRSSAGRRRASRGRLGPPCGGARVRGAGRLRPPPPALCRARASRNAGMRGGGAGLFDLLCRLYFYSARARCSFVRGVADAADREGLPHAELRRAPWAACRRRPPRPRP